MSPIDQDPGASKSFGGCGILEKLPAEVRLRIYEELFHDRTISFHPNVDKSDDYAKDRVTDILSTSKQIRKEAVKVFAAKISVILPIEYSPFFVSPPPNWPVFTKFPPFLPGQDIKHVILKLCPGTYLPKDVTTFLPTLQTWKSIHTESLVMGEKNEVSDLFLADEDWCSMLYGPGVDVTQSETWKVFLSKLFHSKHAVGYLAEIGTLRALPTAAKVVKLLQRDLVFPKLPSIYSTSSGEFIITMLIDVDSLQVEAVLEGRTYKFDIRKHCGRELIDLLEKGRPREVSAGSLFGSFSTPFLSGISD